MNKRFFENIIYVSDGNSRKKLLFYYAGQSMDYPNWFKSESKYSYESAQMMWTVKYMRALDRP